MSNMTVAITPDKSLIKKLGLAGYGTEQAVAETIDNFIHQTDYFYPIYML